MEESRPGDKRDEMAEMRRARPRSATAGLCGDSGTREETSPTCPFHKRKFMINRLSASTPANTYGGRARSRSSCSIHSDLGREEFGWTYMPAHTSASSVLNPGCKSTMSVPGHPRRKQGQGLNQVKECPRLIQYKSNMIYFWCSDADDNDEPAVLCRLCWNHYSHTVACPNISHPDR